MKIETKFNKEDKVYFMHDNKVCEGLITEIDIKINEYGTHIKYGIALYGRANIRAEDKCFLSKEELIKSL